MPLKINGHQVSWAAISSTFIAIFWLAGLSFQVNANGDEIQEQAETKERLVRIEERQEAAKEDMAEVKAEQTAQGAKLTENAIILAKILEKVSEKDE